MRVFKPTRKDARGKRVAYELWYLEFRDHAEIIRRLPGFSDKGQTEKLGVWLDRLIASRVNRESPGKDLSAWLETLPFAMRDTLARFGLLEGSKAAATKALTAHLDDFHASIVARGKTAKHADQVKYRAGELFKACGFRQWSEISDEAVEARLHTMRVDEKVSIQTSNFYLGAAQQFCRWMVEKKRASESPLRGLRKLNVETDRRHVRRALSVDELRRLLDATAAGPERFGVEGAERRLLYKLAVESGLRSNELRSLTKSSFTFGAKLATVSVQAASSKRRKLDTLPLRPDTAAELQRHLAHKLPTTPAFAMPRSDDMAVTIRRDLKAARDAWLADAATPDEKQQRERSDFLATEDEEGRTFDFHALRVTFCTFLGQASVSPKTMQELARHSDVRLTIGRYGRSSVQEQADAVNLLPDLSPAATTQQRATGTDGQASTPAGRENHVAFCVARDDSQPCISVQSHALNASTADGGALTQNDRENAGSPAILQAVLEIHPSGLEPLTFGSVDRNPADGTADAARHCVEAENHVAVCVALLQREKPDLARLVEAWDTLPAALRGRILAMVEASGNKSRGGIKSRRDAGENAGR